MIVQDIVRHTTQLGMLINHAVRKHRNQICVNRSNCSLWLSAVTNVSDFISSFLLYRIILPNERLQKRGTKITHVTGASLACRLLSCGNCAESSHPPAHESAPSAQDSVMLLFPAFFSSGTSFFLFINKRMASQKKSRFSLHKKR